MPRTHGVPRGHKKRAERGPAGRPPSQRPTKTPRPPQLERWQAIIDGKTCPICLDLHGRIYPKHEGPRPPIHFFCRCQRVSFAVIQ
jgi:hypothetical protein